MEVTDPEGHDVGGKAVLLDSNHEKLKLKSSVPELSHITLDSVSIQWRFNVIIPLKDVLHVHV